jgi:hypothetical protein
MHPPGSQAKIAARVSTTATPRGHAARKRNAPRHRCQCRHSQGDCCSDDARETAGTGQSDWEISGTFDGSRRCFECCSFRLTSAVFLVTQVP